MIPIQWAGPVKWWESGRQDGGQILWVVVHQTEGHGGATAAEDGVAYDKQRDDSVSCHVMVDTNTALREVQDKDTAYAAFWNGNAHGIQVELCHVGAWSLGNAEHAATFDNGAQVVAQLLKAHGLPATKLTVGQVAGKLAKGVCDHYDVTRAFPNDGGDHTDVDISGGQPTGFDWTQFMKLVQKYYSGGTTPTKKTEDEVNYYQFSKLTDCPPELGARVVRTDTFGHYWVLQNSWQWSDPAFIDEAVKVVQLGENVHGALPLGTSFVTAFSELTGGCTYVANSKNGVADWVKSAVSGDATPHTHSVSASGTVSTTGTTGPAIS